MTTAASRYRLDTFTGHVQVNMHPQDGGYTYRDPRTIFEVLVDGPAPDIHLVQTAQGSTDAFYHLIGCTAEPGGDLAARPGIKYYRLLPNHYMVVKARDGRLSYLPGRIKSVEAIAAPAKRSRRK